MSCRQMWVNVPKEEVYEALYKITRIGKLSKHLDAIDTIRGLSGMCGWEDGSMLNVSYEDAKLIGYWSNRSLNDAI